MLPTSRTDCHTILTEKSNSLPSNHHTSLSTRCVKVGTSKIINNRKFTPNLICHFHSELLMMDTTLLFKLKPALVMSRQVTRLHEKDHSQTSNQTRPRLSTHYLSANICRIRYPPLRVTVFSIPN